MCLFLPVSDSCGRCRFTRCVWSLIKVAARCIWSPRRSPSPPLPSLPPSLSLFFPDGHKNKENICGRLVGQHGSGRCEAVFRTVWKGKSSSILLHTFFQRCRVTISTETLFFFDFPICALQLSYSEVIRLDQSGVISWARRSPWYAEMTFT